MVVNTFSSSAASLVEFLGDVGVHAPPGRVLQPPLREALTGRAALGGGNRGELLPQRSLLRRRLQPAPRQSPSRFCCRTGHRCTGPVSAVRSRCHRLLSRFAVSLVCGVGNAVAIACCWASAGQVLQIVLTVIVLLALPSPVPLLDANDGGRGRCGRAGRAVLLGRLLPRPVAPPGGVGHPNGGRRHPRRIARQPGVCAGGGR